MLESRRAPVLIRTLENVAIRGVRTALQSLNTALELQPQSPNQVPDRQEIPRTSSCAFFLPMAMHTGSILSKISGIKSKFGAKSKVGVKTGH